MPCSQPDLLVQHAAHGRAVTHRFRLGVAMRDRGTEWSSCRHKQNAGISLPDD